MSVYRRDLDETKYTSLLIKDDELLKEYKWNLKKLKVVSKENFKISLIMEKSIQIFMIMKYQKTLFNISVYQ